MTRQQRSGGSAGSPLTAAVREVLEPVVDGLGLALEDVVLTPAGSRRVLRVVVDGPDDGSPAPTLDAVAQASRVVSAALDAGEVMDGAAYVLEVTSPGVDRPLTVPRHFRRNLRRRVLLTLSDGSEVLGRVMAADEALVLQVDGPKKGMSATRELAWADVVRARVQVDFAAPDAEDRD